MTLQRSPTILIVDDEPDNVSVLYEFLSTNDYEVLVAENGEEALQLIESNTPNLILLDVIMPAPDGFTLCEQFKNNRQVKHVPVLFMMDTSESIDKVRGFNIGGLDYLARPFQIEEVLARIEVHLSVQTLQQQIEAQQNTIAELQTQMTAIQHETETHKGRLSQLNDVYKRFVPQEFLNVLGCKNILDIKLGDLVEKEMTVMFSDIRGFTEISENMTPEERFDFINIYLGQMEPVIREHNGFIDKYIGDGIMALFPTCADDAVRGAISMLKKLDDYNELLKEAGYPSISIGIGMHTGTLMLGTVGGQNRMDGTVIAEAVSVTARIEDLTKSYKTPLLITETTFNRLENKFEYNIRVIDRIKSKGKNKTSVMVYEVFEADTPEQLDLKDETLEYFEEACASYHGKKFERARKLFEEVVIKNPHDEAAKSYIERCKTPEEVEAARQKFTNELFELNKAYERFIPREFLKLLDKESVVDVQLGDHVEQDMTILFCDIRGFTAMSEKMTPQENFDFINIYLGQMEPIIGEHRGFVDKYIGDAIMALFPTSADDAVQGAVAMLKGLVEYNILLQEANYQAIKIGIGLNTGPLMLGTVGGPNRMDGTVISDAVNLAARIEGLTKIYGTALLITDQTYQSLEDIARYHIRVIDRVKVKGKSEAVTVYEVFDGDQPEIVELKAKTLNDFEEGCVYYHGGELDAARTAFEKVLSINEHDDAAIVYLDRCNEFSD
ncbi:adenylate/guanylate cyclase domain-containing protein [Candidatus Albibeggiatoa sp. nov. NOAA]|uniref:adenylate/guanylate cyclase domain-containing protein n=1 Tax=Candidatus Albibeggiatoa sp. nov. NOAA TaxID=3162724 RepID=UPI0032FBDFAF|nr:response regulator [Thiotrichaceae bacterium]